jgi:E3 ubiquitin-protein ligase HERC2
MPSFGLNDLLSDRTILSRPSMNIAMCLLEQHLHIEPNEKGTHLAVRLVAALSSCAQVSSLGARERMWALQILRKLLTTLPKLMESSLQNLLRVKTDDIRPKSVSRMPSSGDSHSSESNSVASTSFSAGIAVLDLSSSASLSSSSFFITKGLRGLPDLLLKQYDYEEPIVRSGKHLMFSPFFKVAKKIFCYLSLLFKMYLTKIKTI